MSRTPSVLKNKLFDCQICVPAAWTNAEVGDWIKSTNPSGTENGWSIRTDLHQRVPCADCAGMVHIVLECL